MREGHFALRTLGGTVRLNQEFEITYNTRESDHVVLWPRTGDDLSLCVVKGPSGTGKTTLLRQVFSRFESGEQVTLAMRFDPEPPDPTDTGIAYLPQHPPIVNHWRLSRLLPSSSNLLDRLIPEWGPELDARIDKHRLYHFSGGQKKKLYLCSALEGLLNQRIGAAVVILDETLDGLGVQGARQCLDRLENYWSTDARPELYLLCVTHLEPERFVPNSIRASSQVRLELTDISKERLRVRIYNA